MSAKIVNNYFDGIPVSKKQMFLFFVIVLSYFFEQMDNQNFAFIAPALIKSWGLDRAQIAQIASLYFLGMTFGGLTGGIFSDIFGRRKTFLVSILIFSTMSVLNGLTDDLTIFKITRALTGFGVFCMMTVSVAYISEISPGESRGKWQSITAAGGFLAMPAIGLISRAIIPTGPEAWRIIFYLGALGYIAFVLGYLYLRESPRWLVAKGRVAEAEKVVEELCGVAVDLSEAARNIPKKENTMEQLIGMFTGKYLKRTLVLIGCIVPSGIGFFILAVWTPTLLNAKGFTLEESLAIGTAFMFGGPFGLFINSFVADKGGRKWPFGILCVLIAAMSAVYAMSGNVYYLVMAIVFTINALGMAISFIKLSYAAEHFPTKMRNTSVGVINALERFAVSGSQLLIPAIMAGYGFQGLFLGVAGLYLFSGLVVMMFGMRTGGKPLEEIE